MDVCTVSLMTGKCQFPARASYALADPIADWLTVQRLRDHLEHPQPNEAEIEARLRAITERASHP